MPDPREDLAVLIRRFIIANGRDPDKTEFRRLAQAVDFPVPSRSFDVAKQTGAGVAESALTTVGGVGAIASPEGAREGIERLPGPLQPLAATAGAFGQVIGGGIQSLAEKLKGALPQPRTGLGRTARTVSRVSGDIGQFFIPGAALAKAGKIASGGTKLARAGRTFAAGAPVSAALGAGDPEQSLTAMVAEFTDSEALQEMAKSPLGAAVGDVLLDGIPAVGAMTVLPSAFRVINTSAGRLRTVWRASLTSQAATTVRNEVTRRLLTPFRAFEDGLTSAIQATARKFNPGQAVPVSRGAMRPLVAIFGTASKKTKDAAIKLLKDAERIGAADESLSRDLLKTRTLEASAGDIQGTGLIAKGTRGYVNFISLLNRTFDMMGRRSSFVAAMERNAAREGLDAADLSRRVAQAAQFPEQANRIISEAERASLGRISALSTEEALANTFALSSKHFGAFGQKFLKTFNDWPALIFVHPFPRFLANSTKFLYDRSIGAMRKVGSKGFFKSLTAGDREAAKAAAQLSEGFLAMGAGMAVRATCGGPKWYQCKIGEDSKGNPRYADLRPFAPLSVPLYAAEWVRKVLGEETDLTGADAVDVFVGIRRLSGTALGLFDFVAEAQSADQLAAGVERYAQTLLGGLTIPAKTLKDLLTFYDEDEGVFRDREAEAEIGPIKLPSVFSEMIANLPVVGKEALPEASTPTREGALGKEEPIGGIPTPALRQLSGLSVQTKTPLEEETQRLGLQPRTRTGVSTLDRFTDQFMGTAIANSNVDELLRSEDYVVLDDFNRRVQLGNVLSAVREQAKAIALQQHGQEVVQEIMKMLEGQTASDQKQKLSGLQIPQAWKDQIFEQLREQAKPKSILGTPIAALADPQGPARDFVARYLPQRAQNRTA